MESKGDDVVSNPSDTPKNDQTQIPTLDQDQEGDGEGKKNETDADGTIQLLLVHVQALKAEKRELELRLNDSREKLHRVEADNRSIAVHLRCLVDKLARTRRDLAADSKDFVAEIDRLNQALKDLEADMAELADANAVMDAEMSNLQVQLLARTEGEEVDVLALRSKAELLETTVLGQIEYLRHFKEKAEAAVKEKVMIRESREEDLKQTVEALEETKTRLESELAGVRSQIDTHLEIQSQHDAAVEGIAWNVKLCWMVAGVASVAALLVLVMTAYDLRIVS